MNQSIVQPVPASVSVYATVSEYCQFQCHNNLLPHHHQQQQTQQHHHNSNNNNFTTTTATNNHNNQTQQSSTKKTKIQNNIPNTKIHEITQNTHKKTNAY